MPYFKVPTTLGDSLVPQVKKWIRIVSTSLERTSYQTQLSLKLIGKIYFLSWGNPVEVSGFARKGRI